MASPAPTTTVNDSTVESDGHVAHIADKGDIVRGSVEGTPIQALCGRWWVPSRSPEGLPVCEPCVAAYQRFKSRGMN